MSTTDRSPLDSAILETVTYPPGRMTEEEFVAWCPEDLRAEWVEGEVIMMSPANTEHNELFMWLAGVLKYYVDEHGLGQVFGPEHTVRFASIRRRRLPDLYFVSADRLSGLRPTYFEGPPDMAIEIVSPDSVTRDWRDKFLDYEAAGVLEYWIIDPMSQRADLYVRTDGKFTQAVEADGWLHSTAMKGLRLKIEWFWPATRPRVPDALRAIADSGSR